MREFFLFLFLFLLSISSLTAQVKKTFEDSRGSTVVVKEEGVNDYDILEAQFGDVPVGKEIKITMDKPPREKAVKPVRKPTPKPKVIKPKPPKKKKKPQPKKVKPKPKPPIPAIRNYDTRAPYPLKRTKLKRYRLKKSKKSKSKKGKCFFF